MGYEVHAGSPREDGRLGAGRTIVNGGLLPCGGLRSGRGRTALLRGVSQEASLGEAGGVARCRATRTRESG